MHIEFMAAEDDGLGHWSVKFKRTNDDGSEEDGTHVFPHDILEWRAAEYGIDPANKELLLDIVLAEPYLTEDDWNGSPNIYDGKSTIAEARDAHISRCKKAKERHQPPGKAKARVRSPLAVIHEQALMNPDAVALKRKLVENNRIHIATKMADPEGDRITQLKDATRRDRSFREA